MYLLFIDFNKNIKVDNNLKQAINSQEVGSTACVGVILFEAGILTFHNPKLTLYRKESAIYSQCR